MCRTASAPPLRAPLRLMAKPLPLALLLLVLVALSGATCLSAATLDDAGLSAAQKVRQRQQKLVDYAMRVSAAMESIVDRGAGDRAGASVLGMPAEETAQRRQAVDDDAAHRQQRARLGLSAESATGGPLRWASQLQDLLKGTGSSVSEAVSAVVRLVQVGVAGSVPEDGAEEQWEAQNRQERLDAQHAIRQRLSREPPMAQGEAAAQPVVMAASPVGTSRRFNVRRNGTSYPCHGGEQAFSPDSVWFCRRDGLIDADTCLSNYNYCVTHCWFRSGNVTCVCPLDSVMHVTSHGVSCLWRPLDLHLELPAEELCADEQSGRLGLARTTPGEYCLSARRKQQLSFDVAWQFSFLSAGVIDGMQSNGERVVYPSFPTNATQWMVGVSGATDAVTGTYDDLSMNADFFRYLTPPTRVTDFAITESHDAVKSAKTFAAVYSFSAPEVMKPLMREEELSNRSVTKAYLGNLDGTSTHTVAYDLSTVPDECVEGNQLYLEVGVGGHGVYLSYRTARIHVALTDLPEPPMRFRYPKPFNVLYIFLIALVGAIVVGSALAIVWYFCQKQDEPDDDLVAKAQRNKKRKEGIEVGRAEKLQRRSGRGGTR